ncbi:(2Fe-2S)-binding protein [Salinarimonas soli]|uniref:(2Fe-2S)-binding protein n=1 Tax=Salinarimonas soli TaxID=1638099 RepID=A0A5B2VBH8_9HYPH|nr:(2Fe-2S)-binding protein [Salinarimonas soli]KAA2236078.1 (2Fe-2S)-binding protein [Salinarimonas soli]
MIVCSCNRLSDRDVSGCMRAADGTCPQTPAQVYRCLGCSPQCGRCAVTIRAIMDKALAAAAAEAAPACGGCAASCSAATNLP